MKLLLLLLLMMKKINMMMMMLFDDCKNSQRERVRAVNIDVVMPTRHVIDHVVRLGNGH